MSNPTAKSGKILFLFSDTGGGHRSAAEAVIEAMQLEFGERFRMEMVDIFRDYAPLPLNRMPEFYPDMVRIPRLWGFGFRLSNGPRRVRMLQAGAWPYVRRSIRSLVRQHPADLVVSMHPMANTPVLRALGPQHPPFVTVVTDLVSAHMFWYDRRVDMCIVPTPEASRKARQAGIGSNRVKVIGLPVADRFCQPLGDRGELRRSLGWGLDRPVVLLVGGGEGMGPLEQTAQALAQARLPISLVVIAGRNAGLKQRLETTRWPMPVYVYGFVRAMPDFMRAADILLTKAGPGTICEALIAGLPLVLYSRLPGQEDGNITYITGHGAGIWAPHHSEVVAAVKFWLNHPDEHARARQACLSLARPDAARQVARQLAELIPEIAEKP